MREIKFRAWDIEEKKMIYGVECGAKIGSDCITFGYFVDFDGEEFELMQFTGLKDKNDKDIYEGDICIDTKIGDCEVVFLNASFCIKNNNTQHYIIGQKRAGNIRVIGNIYEMDSYLNR